MADQKQSTHRAEEFQKSSDIIRSWRSVLEIQLQTIRSILVDVETSGQETAKRLEESLAEESHAAEKARQQVCQENVNLIAKVAQLQSESLRVASTSKVLTATTAFRQTLYHVRSEREDHAQQQARKSKQELQKARQQGRLQAPTHVHQQGNAQILDYFSEFDKSKQQEKEKKSDVPSANLPTPALLTGVHDSLGAVQLHHPSITVSSNTGQQASTDSNITTQKTNVAQQIELSECAVRSPRTVGRVVSDRHVNFFAWRRGRNLLKSILDDWETLDRWEVKAFFGLDFTLRLSRHMSRSSGTDTDVLTQALSSLYKHDLDRNDAHFLVFTEFERQHAANYPPHSRPSGKLEALDFDVVISTIGKVSEDLVKCQKSALGIVEKLPTIPNFCLPTKLSSSFVVSQVGGTQDMFSFCSATVASKQVVKWPEMIKLHLGGDLDTPLLGSSGLVYAVFAAATEKFVDKIMPVLLEIDDGYEYRGHYMVVSIRKLVREEWEQVPRSNRDDCTQEIVGTAWGAKILETSQHRSSSPTMRYQPKMNNSRTTDGLQRPRNGVLVHSKEFGVPLVSIHLQFDHFSEQDNDKLISTNQSWNPEKPTEHIASSKRNDMKAQPMRSLFQNQQKSVELDHKPGVVEPLENIESSEDEIWAPFEISLPSTPRRTKHHALRTTPRIEYTFPPAANDSSDSDYNCDAMEKTDDQIWGGSQRKKRKRTEERSSMVKVMASRKDNQQSLGDGGSTKVRRRHPINADPCTPMKKLKTGGGSEL